MFKIYPLVKMDRLKILYPNVTEPLPLNWSSSSTEKNNSIGLSNNNLRVHYKGNYNLNFFVRLVKFLKCAQQQ